MGATLKKNQDYTALSYMQWAAWGVIDVEKLERMQRRNYINHVRQELALHGLELECAGTSMFPFYRIHTIEREEGNTKPVWQTELTTREDRRQAIKEAFKNVCRLALVRIDPERFATEPHNG